MIYKIETRHGWFCQPEKICNYKFPAQYNASFKGATEYYSKLFAQKAIKVFNLDSAPYHAHIEEFEE